MSVLGKTVTYPHKIDPTILEFIPRVKARESLTQLPAAGSDLWTAYEFSWLSNRGSPEEGIMKLSYGFRSKNIVESKSLKLYLGGYAYTRFQNKDEVTERIKKDLRSGLAID